VTAEVTLVQAECDPIDRLASANFGRHPWEAGNHPDFPLPYPGYIHRRFFHWLARRGGARCQGKQDQYREYSTKAQFEAHCSSYPRITGSKLYAV